MPKTYIETVKTSSMLGLFVLVTTLCFNLYCHFLSSCYSQCFENDLICYLQFPFYAYSYSLIFVAKNHRSRLKDWTKILHYLVKLCKYCLKAFKDSLGFPKSSQKLMKAFKKLSTCLLFSLLPMFFRLLFNSNSLL